MSFDRHVSPSASYSSSGWSRLYGHSPPFNRRAPTSPCAASTPCLLSRCKPHRAGISPPPPLVDFPRFQRRFFISSSAHSGMAILCSLPSTPTHSSVFRLASPLSTSGLFAVFLRLHGRGASSRTRGWRVGRTGPRAFSSSALDTNFSSSSPQKLEPPSLGDITRPDFPILHQEVNGFKLVYLDNAATSQKPFAVMKALSDYYESYNSNVHRGIHYLSAKATDAYELARSKVASFINAPEPRQIVFTRNATEAINLVANSWGLSNLHSGDEILLTVAEHHSAIVPWQFVAQKTGAILKFVGLTEEEIPDIHQLKKLISRKTKLVVVHHVSNVLGSLLPLEEIIPCCHDVGAKVLIDACQSVPHMVVDVKKLDADFLVASSHKMCGPTGVGFLYGKSELLSSMPPFLGGGEMIVDVFQEYSTYADPPSRFEAGTPAIGEAIGLGAAIDYLTSIGMQRIHDYEMDLANYLYLSLQSVPKVRIYGPAPSDRIPRAALCAFNVESIHPTDIATFLDEQHGVAIRSGHHCAQPLHRFLGVSASARASLYFYNTKEEVDVFIDALKDTISFFSKYQ